jgi:hypothetical protein
MKTFEISILILSVVVVLTVQNPLTALSFHNDNTDHFRGGGYGFRHQTVVSGHQLEPSFEVVTTPKRAIIRLASPLFLSTFTITLTTVMTSTATVNWVTTCITSTASLSACPTSGRRRRDVENREILDNENADNRKDGIITALSSSPNR